MPTDTHLKLFKYIDFVKDYALSPLRDEKLYFASVSQLQGVNDKAEFAHDWKHDAYFFKRYSQHFSEPYNRLFANSRILSMAKTLNQHCWNEFCSSGNGICYEFEFDSARTSEDITKGDVQYAPTKVLNVPNYILSKVNTSIRPLLSQLETLDLNQVAHLKQYLDSNEELKDIFLDHIVNELTLKKTDTFRSEDEYRFIHIENSIGAVQPRTKFTDHCLEFSALGLKLLNLYTDSHKHVESKANPKNVTVQLLPF
jgi:hypothetical protein